MNKSGLPGLECKTRHPYSLVNDSLVQERTVPWPQGQGNCTSSQALCPDAASRQEWRSPLVIGPLEHSEPRFCIRTSDFFLRPNVWCFRTWKTLFNGCVERIAITVAESSGKVHMLHAQDRPCATSQRPSDQIYMKFTQRTVASTKLKEKSPQSRRECAAKTCPAASAGPRTGRGEPPLWPRSARREPSRARGRRRAPRSGLLTAARASRGRCRRCCWRRCARRPRRSVGLSCPGP